MKTRQRLSQCSSNMTCRKREKVMQRSPSIRLSHNSLGLASEATHSPPNSTTLTSRIALSPPSKTASSPYRLECQQILSSITEKSTTHSTYSETSEAWWMPCSSSALWLSSASRQSLGINSMSSSWRSSFKSRQNIPRKTRRPWVRSKRGSQSNWVGGNVWWKRVREIYRREAWVKFRRS